MSQAGYTPIQLYYSTTAAAVPTAGNLASGELAINITDGKLYYKSNAGVVTLLAGATAGPAGGSNTQVQFNSSGALAGSANMTFNGTTLTVNDLTDSSLTAGRVTYAGTSGNLVDSANLTFNGTTLTANTLSLTNALTVPNGGTGLTSLTANRVPYGNGTSAFQSSANLTFDGSALASQTLSIAGASAPVTASNERITISNSYDGTILARFYGAPATNLKYINSGWNVATYGSNTAGYMTNGLNGILGDTFGGTYITTQVGNSILFGTLSANGFTNASPTFSGLMHLNNTGLGIGMAPAAKLDVSNGASPASRLRVGVGAGAANTLYSTLAAGDYVSFETNAAEVARFTSAGRLGMGTVTPLSSIGIFGGTGNALGITIQPSGWNYFNRIGPNGTSGNLFYISQNWNAETNTVDNASYGTTAISMNTGDISFWTGATNTVPSTKATIAQSGRVTINNSEYTVIQGAVYGKTPNGTGFSLGYNPSGGNGESQLVWGTGGSTYPFIISSYDGSSTTERARFSTTGYFSIGTTNNLNVLNLIGQSNSGGISWGNYMNVFSEYSSGAAYISSNYYPTYGASGYKTTLTASYGAAGISVSGTGGASNGGLIAFYVNPSTAKTAGDAFTPTEVGRFTANGYFKASNNGTYSGATAPSHEFRTTVDGNYTLTVTSSASSPFGFYVGYPSASPNNTTNRFIDCEDSSALRFQVRSNGGIANYSANNVNLSDRREKTNFAPATSYLDKICAIPVQTFNYIDQNMEDDGGLTLGVVAQDVQAVAPELVAESNWGTEETPKMRLSIYQTDLQYALMKALQELKAEFDAYKASHP